MSYGFPFKHLIVLFVMHWVISRWIICTALNDLYYVEWFGLCWMIYRNYLKQCPRLNERPTSNEPPSSQLKNLMSTPVEMSARSLSIPPQTRKGTFVWKSSMSAEAIIQIVCKNNETKVFYSQIFFVFYNTEIYKHIL